MRTWPLLLLIGCESEALIAAEMEQVLFDGQAVIATQLVALEVLSHAFDETTIGTTTGTQRHGSSCGCPCTERVGDTPPYIVSLDYDELGCLPLSGLLPSNMAGHVVLEHDGQTTSATFDGLQLGLTHQIEGTLEGTVSPDVSEIIISNAQIEAGSYTVSLDTTTTIDDDGLQLHGGAQVAGEAPAPIEITDLQLPWDEIPPPCPSPSSGRMRLSASTEVEVDFASPGDGLVTVTRKGRISQPTDFCGYRTDLF